MTRMMKKEMLRGKKEPKQPNRETIAAIEEAERLLKDPNTRTYASVEELLVALEEDEETSMSLKEIYRLIEALESAGFTAQEIVDLIKYIESGDPQYKPRKREECS